MKTAKAILLGLTLVALMVPLAQSVFFIGITNYIATNGGITSFANNFTATSLTYPDGLNRFTALRWNGHLRGNVGVDCDTGVNISVTAITANSISYTVTTAAPGNVLSYVYYRRNIPTGFLQPPTGIVGGTYTYDAATHITNVTTTGSPVNVVLSFGAVGGIPPSYHLFYASGILLGLLPLIIIYVVMNDLKEGNFGTSTAGKVVLIVALMSALAWIIQGWGY